MSIRRAVRAAFKSIHSLTAYNRYLKACLRPPRHTNRERGAKKRKQDIKMKMAIGRNLSGTSRKPVRVHAVPTAPKAVPVLHTKSKLHQIHVCVLRAPYSALQQSRTFYWLDPGNHSCRFNEISGLVSGHRKKGNEGNGGRNKNREHVEGGKRTSSRASFSAFPDAPSEGGPTPGCRTVKQLQ